MNYIVLLTCVVCLVIYVVMVVVLRKLDQLDVSRVRIIFFCGKGGYFKYEILVKIGWVRGLGEGIGYFIQVFWSFLFVLFGFVFRIVVMMMNDTEEGFVLLGVV